MKAKQLRFLRGDIVSHCIRGNGIFEHYCADSSNCFVRLEDSGESERVTTTFIRLVGPAEISDRNSSKKNRKTHP